MAQQTTHQRNNDCICNRGIVLSVRSMWIATSSNNGTTRNDIFYVAYAGATCEAVWSEPSVSRVGGWCEMAASLWGCELGSKGISAVGRCFQAVQWRPWLRTLLCDSNLWSIISSCMNIQQIWSPIQNQSIITWSNGNAINSSYSSKQNSHTSGENYRKKHPTTLIVTWETVLWCVHAHSQCVSSPSYH
jgi:hypothetical protein